MNLPVQSRGCPFVIAFSEPAVWTALREHHVLGAVATTMMLPEDLRKAAKDELGLKQILIHDSVTFCWIFCVCVRLDNVVPLQVCIYSIA